MSAAGNLLGVAFTGTIGAGKTTVAEALSGLLHVRGMRHALIDLDWLGQVYPPPDGNDPYSLDLALTNLGMITPNFLAAGAAYFVIAATLTSARQLDALRHALPQVSLSVCRVEASPATTGGRIRSRDRGYLRDDFLTRTDALAQQIRFAEIEDFTVSNDGRSPNDVAEEALRRLGWA